MYIHYNNHYIITGADNAITVGWSDGPNHERDTSKAICINEQGGYQFRVYPDGEENPPLYTFDGIPLYKYVDGAVQRRTEDEIKTDRSAIPAPPPSPMEQMRAENTLLRAQIAAATDRQEFLEDCIAEMAVQVYGV